MVGIVILNYNTQFDTIKCVESITKTTLTKYRIFIVDNHSSDDSFHNLSTLYFDTQNIELIESASNAGYAAGNNLGIHRALEYGSELVILSNSDVVYYDGAIDYMFEQVQINDKIGIIGPQILLQDGKRQESPRMNYNFSNYLINKKPFIYFDFINKRDEVYYKNYSYDEVLIFYGLISGCCIGLTRKYFDLCGLLDEGTFLYFEEAIIAHKAKSKELLTCVLPKSLVLHMTSTSIGNPNSAFSRYHRYYSGLYMLKKYVKINNFQLLIASTINLLPMIVNSLHDKSYKIFLKKFLADIVNLWKFKES